MTSVELEVYRDADNPVTVLIDMGEYEGQTLAAASLAIKRLEGDADEDALAIVSITDVLSEGGIVEDGTEVVGGETVAVGYCRFIVRASALDGVPLGAYVYGVKARLSNNQIVAPHEARGIVCVSAAGAVANP